MFAKGAYRTRVPLALAVAIGMFTVAPGQPASAQEKQPAKQAKPAAKGESKSAPSKKGPAPGPAPAPQAAATAGGPTLLGQFGDWGAYSANSGGRVLCYALAKPASQTTVPAGRPRDPAYIFVSTRPAENVRNEISVVIGYPFKPGSEATVELGSANCAMCTQADGAWVKNPAEEARMVDAMRKGADLVVKGESGRGTKSADSYALRGLAQALDRIAQECK